jgi:hypothetical protein
LRRAGPFRSPSSCSRRRRRGRDARELAPGRVRRGNDRHGRHGGSGLEM